MKKLLSILIYLLVFFDLHSANLKEIQYEILTEKTLEEVCRKGFGCSNTIKRIISSNDGFIFETYLTDGSDSVWCTPNVNDKIKNIPCSTIGDYGGGRHVMKITNKQTKKTITIEGAGGKLERISTPFNHPHIILINHNGGVSCCHEYLTYSKESLKFISASRKSKFD